MIDGGMDFNYEPDINWGPQPPGWPEGEPWPPVYDGGDDGGAGGTGDGFPDVSTRPTLEYPEFTMPGREYGAPQYRATELGELPAFYGANQYPTGDEIMEAYLSGSMTPQDQQRFDINKDGRVTPADASLAHSGEGRQPDSSMSKRRIDAKAQKAGASGQRKVQSAVDRALSYSFDDPNLQAASVGQTIAGQGAGLAGAQSVAGKQAVGEATREKGFEYAAAAKNYDAQVGTIMQQYKSDTDAAQRNFATLSGVFDMDMKSAWDEATWNHNTRVLEAQMNFEALFEVFLLSNVKMERIIHRTG